MYVTIGIAIAIITLICGLGVSIVLFQCDLQDGNEDWTDLVDSTGLSFLGAALAGLLWPAAIVVAIMFGIAGWLKHRQNLRDREV